MEGTMGRMIEKIAEGAGIDIRYAAGLSLVDGSDVPALIAACELAGVRILGAEGFEIVDGGVRPDMDAILDLSSVSEVHASAREAARFFAALDGSNLVFDLTVDDGA